ncbi:MAG: hypothetical protein JWN89_716 [Parcubacteria group bacterium]|nr:hypothetical protein [Parcubacteria group bacterium]
MPKSKIILALGFLIALLPVLGFPHSWESFFQVLFGLSIVLLSVLISVDRRLSLKARVQKRQARKRAVIETNPEVQFGRRASDVAEVPRSRFGRRASDPVIPVPILEEEGPEVQ